MSHGFSADYTKTHKSRLKYVIEYDAHKTAQNEPKT